MYRYKNLPLFIIRFLTLPTDQLKLGRIDVRLKKPFSLRGYLDAETARRRTTTTNSTRATAIELKKEQAVLLRSLGYQVLSDINSVSVIMPAALIGRSFPLSSLGAER